MKAALLLLALAAGSRLGPFDFALAAGLLALWLLPDWLYKLHLLGQARRRSQEREHQQPH